ncbi:MAG: hypothetical protein ACXWRZ_16375 [Bdellovibrio sp.]
MSTGYSYAQNSSVAASTVATSTTTAPNKSEKKWSLPLSYEMATTLHTENSYERQLQETFAVSPSFRLSKNWKLSAGISVIKDDSVSNAGQTGFDNTTVSVSHTHALTDYIVWTNSMGGVLPTNQQIREQTSFQGAARAATAISFDQLFLNSSLLYKLSFNRNFHEFNISSAGTYNTRDVIGQLVNYSVPLTKAFSLSTSFYYAMAHTYADDLTSRFSLGADLQWNATKNFSMVVGTSNDGNALKPNGRDSNIEFFNDNTSSIKLGLNYIL